MRKTSIIHYDEVDVRKIVHDELNKAKDPWISEITERVTDQVSEKIAKFKDDIITILDKVMGELKAIREEFTVMGQKLSEHSDTLEYHETRIAKLENPLPTS